MPRLIAAALVDGVPGPAELWTLRRIASAAGELSVVQSVRAPAVPPWQRARALIRTGGLRAGLARFAAAEAASRIAVEDRAALERLFDFDDLRAWWLKSGIAPVKVEALDSAKTRAALSTPGLDVIVAISGGMPKPAVCALARIAVLTVRHGPIVRGIVDGRRDRIGAAVRAAGGGIGADSVVWRGGPQLAPGDTDVDLFFRAHLEASEALVRLLDACASGAGLRPLASSADDGASNASAPDLIGLLRLVCLGRGRRARVLLERGVEC